MQVTVALIADPDSPFTEMAGDDWNTPHADRRKAVIEVDSTATLAQVLEDAADALNLRPPEDHHVGRFSARWSRVTFYRPEDETGVERVIWRLGELTLVDAHGRAIFGVHDNRTITMQQLVRTGEAGVLDGDPLRPYLVVEVPYGDAPPIDLATYREALDVLWTVVTTASTIGGALAFGQFVIERIRARLEAGKRALEGAWPGLPQRIARPDQLWRLAELHPWRAEDLAELLDCDVDTVADLLTASGFDANEQGLWTAAETDDARVLHEMHTAVNQAFRRAGDEAPAELGAAVEALLRTGRLPEVPEGDDEDFWGVGATRRERARAAGTRSDLTYVRSFCSRTSRPGSDQLLNPADSSTDLAIHKVETNTHPWSRLLLKTPSGAEIEVRVDVDDGDPDGLFAAELPEFVDAVAFSEDPARFDVMRHLLGTRMIAAIAVEPDTSSDDLAIAIAVARTLASVAGGLLHVDQVSEEGDRAFILADRTLPTPW